MRKADDPGKGASTRPTLTMRIYNPIDGRPEEVKVLR
jgi:hypothetical protein